MRLVNTKDVTLDGAVFALYAKRDIMDVAAGTVKMYFLNV